MRTIALALLFSFCLPLFGNAQVPTGISAPLTIDLEPVLPNPFETFTARVNDYSVNSSGATITWYVDGEVQSEFTNERSIELQASGIGERTNITAELTLPNNQTIRANRTVTPTRVDIIFEPQTYTPAFYEGRALPSVGSEVRFVALPFTGQKLSPSSYSYVWRLNNQVLEGGQMKGKNAVTIEVPFQPNPYISVTVFAPSGEAVARRSITIPTTEPEVQFYPVSTLNDISPLAIGDTFTVSGKEALVRAQPYYLDLNALNSSDTSWKVDHRTVAAGKGEFDIAVQRLGAGNSSPVEFLIQNTVDFLQRAKGSFSLTF